MKVVYLPANQAYVVTFGEQIISLYDKGGRIGGIFNTLEEVDRALHLCDLKRNGSNIELDN
tara:strand:+ start:5922 stop:6104 length:183 start_codon:yes stop_codon:yes gene_type:complete